MAKPDRYHHGDLRAALLDAAEAELAEKGVEGFSLRAVAKRAGVSHAAPAHHFRDVAGLLTALAAKGFERFREIQLESLAAGGDDPREQMLEGGLGYIRFALSHPALFRLMFSSKWPEHEDERLSQVASDAFKHLRFGVTAIRGEDPEHSEAARTDLVALWSIVHGLANLMIEDRPRYLTEASEEEQARILREVISRSMP